MMDWNGGERQVENPTSKYIAYYDSYSFFTTSQISVEKNQMESVFVTKVEDCVVCNLENKRSINVS